MGKKMQSFIDVVAKEVNSAREQLYETSEQLRTGQIVADRSPREGEHKMNQENTMERANRLSHQQHHEPPKQEIEQER